MNYSLNQLSKCGRHWRFWNYKDIVIFENFLFWWGQPNIMMILEFHQMVQSLLKLCLKFLSMCPFKANKGVLQDWFTKCLPMTFGQINGDNIRGSWVWQTWEVAKFSGIVNNIGKSTPFLMCKVKIFPLGFKKWKDWRIYYWILVGILRIC